MADLFSFSSADELIDLLKKASFVVSEKNQKLMQLYSSLGDSFRDEAYENFKREMQNSYLSFNEITKSLETTITSIQRYRDKLYEISCEGSSIATFDIDPPKVLKKDPLVLLHEGASAIERRLEFKADDYRDKNYSEEEIEKFIQADKLAFQREFLDEAFPGQNVSESIFNHIYTSPNRAAEEKLLALNTIDT